MKTNKRGISLIVLVITIIVIIILAAAVILTLNGNNPIDNSKQATFDNDCAELKSAMSMYITTFMAKDANHDGPFDIEGADTETTDDDTKITIGSGTEAIPAKVVGAKPEDADDPENYRTPGNAVNWTTLGFSEQPASIKSATYNATTGLFTIEPRNTGINTKTDW